MTQQATQRETGQAPVSLNILKKCSTTKARLGVVTTPHGTFDTPAYMPVGTQGAMKGLMPWSVKSVGSQIILGNTYHLMLRPGPDLVAELGGLHAMASWDGPMLTDSGGYQAYSMADINAVDEEGVTFKSILDGSKVRLTPELAIEVQNKLGADIIMPLDDCPPAVDPATMNQSRLRIQAQQSRAGKKAYDHEKRIAEANERTVRWLDRCKAANSRPTEQALFGIVQGGTDLDARTQSAREVAAIELPGYAIGGVAVGESSTDIVRVVDHTAPLLPESKPRYLMGVGYERDIYHAVRAGVDMFDCVLPTRNGRNANAFTRAGQIRLKNARFTNDPRPLDETYAEELGLENPTQVTAAQIQSLVHAGKAPHDCLGVFSRAYLRHLFAAKEMLGPIIVSLHNVRHFQRLMVDIRTAIRDDAWPDLERRWPVVTAPSAPLRAPEAD